MIHERLKEIAKSKIITFDAFDLVQFINVLRGYIGAAQDTHHYLLVEIDYFLSQAQYEKRTSLDSTQAL